MPAALRAKLWIVTAVLVLAPTSAAPPAAKFHVETLADGVHLFRPDAAQTERSNTLVIERADGLLLVGAQPTAAAARELLDVVARRIDGVIRYLVLPHSHAEAAGGASAFPGSTLIIASRAFDQALDDEQYDFGAEARRRSPSSESWQPPARPAATLLLDARVVLADSRNKVEIVPFGGLHSTGDMLLRVGDEEIIYVGALICPNGDPYAGHDPRDSDIARWAGQLSQLIRQRPQTLVPLQGPAIGFDGLRRQRNALSWLQAQVDNGVADALPLDQVRDRILAAESIGEHFDVDSPFLPSFIDKAIDEVVIDHRKRQRN